MKNKERERGSECWFLEKLTVLNQRVRKNCEDNLQVTIRFGMNKEDPASRNLKQGLLLLHKLYCVKTVLPQKDFSPTLENKAMTYPPPPDYGSNLHSPSKAIN